MPDALIETPTATTKGTRREAIMTSHSTSFGQAFSLHADLQEMISVAAQNGLTLYPSMIADRLLADHHPLNFERADVIDAVISAALNAGVLVKHGSAPRQ